MAVPNTRTAVGLDLSPHAIGTTKGANPVRIFQSGAPGADVSTCYTDGVDTMCFGMVGNVAYVNVAGVTAFSLTSTRLTVPNLTSSGDVTATTLFNLAGIETPITAGVGGTQANAVALSATKSVHNVTIVGSANDSVKLPAATGSGQTHFVMNSAAANSMQVFGTGSDTINDVVFSTGVAQAAGKGAWYVDIAAGKWYRSLGA
jgi:hypothetical protein